MFLPLLFLASLCQLYASPIDRNHPLLHDTQSLLNTRDTASGTGDHLRTTYGIVWSCFVTILACVWSAVHPNIPGPYDGGWTILKRRITTTFCALLAPELLVMWALRQHFAAKKIAEDYAGSVVKAGPDRSAMREWFSGLPAHTAERHEPRLMRSRIFSNGSSSNMRPVTSIKQQYLNVLEQQPEKLLTLKPLGKREPWTMTHGFFVQMGGFILYRGNEPVEVLEFDYMWFLIQEGYIAAPTVTEAELKDRSKGNALSKCVIVLQTSWFVVQCLARLASRLPLSELEVITLAFAVMNGIVYWLWWDKPQGVDTAIPIHLQFSDGCRRGSTEAAAEHDAENLTSSGLNSEEPLETELKPLQERSGTDAQVNEATQLLSETMEDLKAQDISTSETVPSEQSFKMDRGMIESQPLINPQGETESSTSSILSTATQATKPWMLILSFFQKSFKITVYPLIQLNNMISNSEIPDSSLNVPMFYGYYDSESEKRMTLLTAALLIGVLFGAVHFFAWASVFPSHAEQLIWRVSVLITTGAPLLFLLAMFIETKGRLRNIANKFATILVIVTSVAYVLGRIALLTVALLSLRVLQHDVFIQISWTSYIPHF